VDTLTSHLSTSLKSLIRRMTRPFALPSLDREIAAQAHPPKVHPLIRPMGPLVQPYQDGPVKSTLAPEARKTPLLPPQSLVKHQPTTPTTTTTTAGATSEVEPERINHSAKLVEQHRITLPVGATGDNVAVARLHAEAYARARGFDIKPGSFSVLTTNPLVPNGPTAGVSFELVVGTGDIDTSAHTERWTWGGAIDWWRRLLGPDQPEGKLLSLVDAEGRRRGGRITGMRPGAPGSEGFEVKGEFTDGQQPGGFSGRWMGPDALRGFTGAKPWPDYPEGADQRPPWMSRADGDDSEGE